MGYFVSFEEVCIEKGFLAAEPEAGNDLLHLVQPSPAAGFDSVFVAKLHRHGNRESILNRGIMKNK
jgi:hypothetical protein